MKKKSLFSLNRNNLGFSFNRNNYGLSYDKNKMENKMKQIIIKVRIINKLENIIYGQIKLLMAFLSLYFLFVLSNKFFEPFFFTLWKINEMA